MCDQFLHWVIRWVLSTDTYLHADTINRRKKLHVVEWVNEGGLATGHQIPSDNFHREIGKKSIKVNKSSSPSPFLCDRNTCFSNSKLTLPKAIWSDKQKQHQNKKKKCIVSGIEESGQVENKQYNNHFSLCSMFVFRSGWNSTTRTVYQRTTKLVFIAAYFFVCCFSWCNEKWDVIQINKSNHNPWHQPNRIADVKTVVWHFCWCTTKMANTNLWPVHSLRTSSKKYYFYGRMRQEKRDSLNWSLDCTLHNSNFNNCTQWIRLWAFDYIFRFRIFAWLDDVVIRQR